ncbi:MAG: hypothetical protein ABI724_12715 [Betaproteobacteria bacterium]
MQASPACNSDIAVLVRPGGNDSVVEKKVLLADLARCELVRLGIDLPPVRVQAVRAEFFRDLELLDDDAASTWLAGTGLSEEDFNTVMTDFAAVLTVEAHHRERLVPRVELHRRLMGARTRTLAG